MRRVAIYGFVARTGGASWDALEAALDDDAPDGSADDAEPGEAGAQADAAGQGEDAASAAAAGHAGDAERPEDEDADAGDADENAEADADAEADAAADADADAEDADAGDADADADAEADADADADAEEADAGDADAEAASEGGQADDAAHGAAAGAAASGEGSPTVVLSEDLISTSIARVPGAARVTPSAPAKGARRAQAAEGDREAEADEDADEDGDGDDRGLDEDQSDDERDGDESDDERDVDQGDADEGDDDDEELPAPREIADVTLDANDVAAWMAREIAVELEQSEVLEPVMVELETGAIDPASPEELGSVAEAAGAELALGGYLRVTEEILEIALVLADDTGELRGHWNLEMPLGQGPWAPQEIARALLLAAGEDASAPPEVIAAPVPPVAFLALCRAARLLAQAPAEAAADLEEDAGAEREAKLRSTDVRDACDDLLAVLEAAPELTRARDLLLEAAQEAVGGEAMPALLSALEQLADLRPGDAAALIALGEYRVLHLDRVGARDLFLAARDAAEDGDEEVAALSRLAQLAEEGGRLDEAVQHLRAATRVLDDPELYLRLASLLENTDPAECLRALLRASVLAPDEVGVRLALAVALRNHGEVDRAADEAAVAAELAAQAQDPDASAQAAELLRELTGDSGLN